MKQIDMDRYIYKLVPDYMYIDYAEGEYWKSHMTNQLVNPWSDDRYPSSNSIWYKITNIMYDTSASQVPNQFKSTSYGRCLLVSPVELIFEAHQDETIHRLKNYGDRFVYACFSSEDDLFRSPTIKFMGNAQQIREMVDYDESTGKYNGDFPYVVELRF